MNRPLRADAKRNRERIIAATRSAIAEAGLVASVDDIAGRAEVGVGTIYRRFGDRDGLIREVLLDSLHILTSAAEQAAHQDPAMAIRDFAQRALDTRLGVLAPVMLPVMSQALRTDKAFGADRARLLAAVRNLVERAREDAGLRADVTAVDFLLALASASRPLPGIPESLDANQTGRTIAILLDGLFTPDPAALPGKAGTPADLDNALLRN